MINQEQNNIDVGVNQSDSLSENTATKPKRFWRKKKLWILVSAFVVVATVGIILTVYLTKASIEYPLPTPPQPVNPWVKEFNPYQGELNSDCQFRCDSYIHLNETLAKEGFNAALNLYGHQSQQDSYSYKPVDPRKVYHNSLKMTYSMYLTSTMIGQQAIHIDLQPYSGHYPKVPESILKRPKPFLLGKKSMMDFIEPSYYGYSFAFRNRYTKENVLDTFNRKLIVSSKYSEIGFTLPTKRLYGLGQRNGQFQLKNGTYSLYAKGQKSTLPKDEGMGGTSGSHIHPFLLAQTKNKDFIGIFFIATNNQAFEILYFDGYEEVVLNYITLCEHIEFYFFMGDTAAQVISNYQKLVGTPQLPPYYALGIFQGTQMNVQEFKTLISDQQSMRLSLEGYQIDSYYDPGDTFNINDPELKQVAQGLKEDNMKLILALKASYKNDEQLFAKQLANELNCSVKSNLTAEDLIGMVDGEQVNFFNPFVNSEIFFSKGLQNLKQLIEKYDGIDFQGLQYANEINGEIINKNIPNLNGISKARSLFLTKEDKIGYNETYLLNDTLDIWDNSFYYLPLIPGFKNSEYLDTLTLSANASRRIELNDTLSFEYYLHNANSHSNIQKMSQAMKNNTNQRPFILSESSWVGSQNSSIALITNIMRTQEDLNGTISMAMQLSMYGFSNIMIDACGTKGPFDETLCTKWMQVAAFLPMARNYYTQTYWDEDKQAHVKNPRSEFVHFSSQENLQSVNDSLQLKLTYSLYVYSQMYEIHKNGGSIVRPLYFDYPHDDNLTEDYISTFLLGDSLLVTPNLYGKESYQVYIPKGIWVDIFNLKSVKEITMGQYLNLSSAFNHTNVFLRSGKIVPFQPNTKGYISTQDFRNQLKTSLLVLRDEALSAEGTIFIDDGISIDSISSNQYNHWKVSMGNKNIRFWLNKGNRDYQPENVTQNVIEEIIIANAADIKDTFFACHIDRNFDIQQVEIFYDSKQETLTLKLGDGEGIKLNDLNSITFGNTYSDIDICKYGFSIYLDESTLEETDTEVKATLKRFIDVESSYADVSFKAQLDSDDGALSIDIGLAQKDSNSENNPIKEKPKNELNKKLSDFMIYEKSGQVPFSFALIKEGIPDQIIYKSNPNKFYIHKEFMGILEAQIFFNGTSTFPFMGLGQREGSLFFPKDAKQVVTVNSVAQDIGEASKEDNPTKNIHGFQSLYAYQVNDKEYLGVYDLIQKPSDYFLDFKEPLSKKITVVKAISQFSLKFIRGPSINSITQQYSEFYLPPYWAFGYHIGSQQYYTYNDLKNALDQYYYKKFPFDSFWLDVNYMDDYKPFTLSSSYRYLPNYIQKYKSRDVRFVPIITSGISITQKASDQVGQSGDQDDMYYKVEKEDGSEENLLAEQLCGKVYIPHLQGNSKYKWAKLLEDLGNTLGLNYYQQQYFDGLWLDQNIPTNYCNGFCNPNQRPNKGRIQNQMIYVPGQRDLETNTLGLNSFYIENIPEDSFYQNLNEYDQLQVNAIIHLYYLNSYQIGFILSESTSSQSNKYTHQKVGNVKTSYQGLIQTINQMFSLSFFSKSFTGGDICGYYQDEEYQNYGDKFYILCTRWHQVGALFPFSRNHNSVDNLNHETYQFCNHHYNANLTYGDIMRNAILLKYSFVRYYFSQFGEIQENGGSFFQPLPFIWSNDTFAYQNMTDNIMLGQALKLSIKIDFENSQENQYFYFPKGQWCKVYPYSSTNDKDCFISEGEGGDQSVQYLQNSLLDYYLHIRGGHMIPFKNATTRQRSIETLEDLNQYHLDIMIHPSQEDFEIEINGQQEFVRASGQIWYQEKKRFDVKMRYNMMLKYQNYSVNITIARDKSKQFYHFNDYEEVEKIYLFGTKLAGFPQEIQEVIYKPTDEKDSHSLNFTLDDYRDLITIDCLVHDSKYRYLPYLEDLGNIQIIYQAEKEV